MIINGLYILAAVVLAWIIWPDTPVEKAVKKEKQYKKGYAWAASELLLGTTFYEIESHCDCARHFGDRDDFENGATVALFDLQKLINTPRAPIPSPTHKNRWI